MILAAPEFDTYGSIRRFAAHPDDKLANASFRLLMRRTEMHTLWKVGESSKTVDDLQAKLKLLTGISEDVFVEPEEEEHTMTPEKLASMSHEDRMAFMDQQILAAGLDPSAFMTGNTQVPSTS